MKNQQIPLYHLVSTSMFNLYQARLRISLGTKCSRRIREKMSGWPEPRRLRQKQRRQSVQCMRLRQCCCRGGQSERRGQMNRRAFRSHPRTEPQASGSFGSNAQGCHVLARGKEDTLKLQSTARPAVLSRLSSNNLAIAHGVYHINPWYTN